MVQSKLLMQLKPKLNYRKIKLNFYDKIMVENEKFFINNDEIKLEAEFYESKTDKKSGIVICHPHPQIN